MPAARDLAIAGVFVLLGLVSLPGIDRISPDDRPVDAGAVLLVLVATAALGFRRLWPVAVLLVSAASASAYLLLGYPHGPVIFAVALAVLTAARHCPAAAVGRCLARRVRRAAPGPATTPRRHRRRGRRARGDRVGGDPATRSAWPGGWSSRRTSASAPRPTSGWSSTSGSGSRRRCTTWSATPWRRSRCRPTSPCTSGRSRSRRRWRRSAGRAARRWRSCARR